MHFVYAILMIILVVGCGPSPDDARKEIVAMTGRYSTDAFIAAVKGNDLRIVELYLAAGMDPNTRNGLPLKAAAGEGHAEIVRLLLDAGMDPNTKNGGLRAAAQFPGHDEIVRLLLDAGAQDDDETIKRFPDADLRSATEAYALRGNVEMVRALLDAGVPSGSDAAATWSTALVQAAGEGHAEIVRLLLDAGAQDDGETLIRAVRRGDTEIVGMLLDAGAPEGAVWNRLIFTPVYDGYTREERGKRALRKHYRHGYDSALAAAATLLDAGGSGATVLEEGKTVMDWAQEGLRSCWNPNRLVVKRCESARATLLELLQQHQ